MFKAGSKHIGFLFLIVTIVSVLSLSLMVAPMVQADPTTDRLVLERGDGEERQADESAEDEEAGEEEGDEVTEENNDEGTAEEAGEGE